MTGHKSTRERFGAIFFAFVMVTSMVALGAAGFAGTAAASVDTGTVDLGNGDGSQVTVQSGTTLSNVQVDTSGSTDDVYVVIDENGNGQYDSGESFATGTVGSDPSTDVDVGDLNVPSSLSAGTFTILAKQDTSLANGDSSFDETANLLTIDNTLSGGSSGGISYEISSSASEDVVAGSQDEELGQIKIRDEVGGEFSGELDLYFPQGIKVNTSASSLDTNTVTQVDGSVTIDSVSVSNNSNNVNIDLSGTSSAGETIRIKSGALHVEVDGNQLDTSSGSTPTPVPAEIRHFSNTFVTGTDGAGTAFLQAGSPNAGTTGTSPLNVGANGQDLSASSAIQIQDIDTTDGTTEIGNNSEIIVTIEPNSGITFDERQEGQAGLLGTTDVDSDGTDDLDQDNIVIQENELRIPVIDPIDGSTTRSFDINTADNANEVKFNVSNIASSTADINVSIQPSSPSTQYTIGSTDSATISNAINVNTPSVNFNVGNDDNGQVAVGTEQQNAEVVAGGSGDGNLAIDLSTATAPANSYINITTNNSAVTFDTSATALTGDGSDLDLDRGSNNIVASEINNVSIKENVIAIGIGSSDIGGTTDDEIGIPLSNTASGGSAAPGKFRLNVSSVPADDQKVQFNATIGGFSTADSDNVLNLERPDLVLNKDGGANVTIDVDNDGVNGFEIGDNSDLDDALLITSDDVEGQAAGDTFVNVTLESGTGVTFDTSATANAPGDGSQTNNELDVNSDDNDAIKNVTVTQSTLAIGLTSTGLDEVDDEIRVDEIFVNATSDASNTTVSVTTNTGNNLVTTDISRIIATSATTPSNIAVDADPSDSLDDFTNGQVSSVQNPTVDETVAGAVRVQNGGNFGGADVTLEIVETPEGSSGSSLNTTKLTTNQDGEAFYNFTAGDTTGDYVVNASIDGVSGGLNVTYTAQPGEVADVTVTPIENAIVGGSNDLDQAALYVNATDANGNPVSATPTVDVTADNVGASEIGAYEDKDPDGSRDDLSAPNAPDDDLTDGSFTIDDTNNDGSSVLEINSDQVEDVTVTVSYQGNSDSGTVTFYDQVGQVDLTLNRSTVAVADAVSAEATISESDGTTIEVPGVTVDYDDNNDANTTFGGGADSDSTTTNASGVASVTVTAEQNGTSTIDARTNLRADSTTLTIDEQADTGSPLDGTAGEYDSDGDGQVTASELGSASTAFANGELTASELGDVAIAFANS